jgi:alcohol dehydrogenase
MVPETLFLGHCVVTSRDVASRLSFYSPYREVAGMSQVISFSPSPSFFGFGALQKIPEVVSSRGFRRLLIFTDSQIARSGILDRVLGLLTGSIDCEVFDGVPAEPRSIDMEGQKGHWGKGFHALLALGGGSSMDFAKAMSILMTHGGSLRDYLGEGSVPGPVIPVVCVPTTSGTGSQCTQTTVFSIDGVKRGVSSEFIRPVVSVVDPDLTMNLSPAVTRNAGYDALMHACESFVARPSVDVPERPILYQGSNPFSRSLSTEAFRAIWGSYRRAISDGSDREARMGMSLGSHLAGMAFSHSGLGLVHALASAVGGMIDAPHGVCLAACTDMGLGYNFEFCEEGFAILADIMSGGNRAGSGRASGVDFRIAMRDLTLELGFPSRPSELGLRKEDAGTLLEKTLLQKRRIATNPRPLDGELLSFIREGI